MKSLLRFIHSLTISDVVLISILVTNICLVVYHKNKPLLDPYIDLKSRQIKYLIYGPTTPYRTDEDPEGAWIYDTV